MKRKEITNVLEFVKSAVSDNPITPIFSAFVFDKGTVYGFNDQLAIIGPCDIQSSFAVRAITLFGFLKNSRAKNVSFTLSDDDVIVKAGKSKITLPCNHSDEFIFSEPDEDWDFKIDITKKLIDGIKTCLVTSSDDFSLPALMGVTLIINKNITLYSCDGDVVSKYKVGKAEREITEEYFTLPNEFCNSIIKLFEKEGSLGKISINKNWAKAKFNNGYIIYGRTIEKNDPLDYEVLIKRTLKSKPTYIKIPKGLNNALLRARVVADMEGKSTLITIQNNKMVMFTKTEIGDVRDVIMLREDHPDIEVSVNASLIQRSALLCEQMAILDNCTCYKSSDTLFQILTNMSD